MTLVKNFCSKEHAQKLDNLNDALWKLKREIEAEQSEEKQLIAYEPIVELIKQACYLLDIASALHNLERPF